MTQFLHILKLCLEQTSLNRGRLSERKSRHLDPFFTFSYFTYFSSDLFSEGFFKFCFCFKQNQKDAYTIFVNFFTILDLLIRNNFLIFILKFLIFLILIQFAILHRIFHNHLVEAACIFKNECCI